MLALGINVSIGYSRAYTVVSIHPTGVFSLMVVLSWQYFTPEYEFHILPPIVLHKQDLIFTIVIHASFSLSPRSSSC